MIVRTAFVALKTGHEVVVAADDLKIVDICKSNQIECILTSKHHQSGSERLAEAIQILGLADNEIIINVQGDEPFLEPHVINDLHCYLDSLLRDFKTVPLSQTPVLMASAYKKISLQQARDPNFVKVVLDKNQYALYFSRSLIPFVRENPEEISYYGHLGIYGYRADFLQHFCSLPIPHLEQYERLEQLRVLHYGYNIAMLEVESHSFGIDTMQDLQCALQMFNVKEEEY